MRVRYTVGESQTVVEIKGDDFNADLHEHLRKWMAHGAPAPECDEKFESVLRERKNNRESGQRVAQHGPNEEGGHTVRSPSD